MARAVVRGPYFFHRYFDGADFRGDALDSFGGLQMQIGNRCAAIACWSCSVVLFLIALALAAAPASAQTFRGTILGTVTDTSGGSIADASVSVDNTGTGLVRTTITASDGSYFVPELPIGNYQVTIQKDGFTRSVTNDIRVDVAVESRVDAVLKPGDVKQQVVVSATTQPQVQTTSNTLGGVMEEHQVTNLPANGRDFQKLIFLTPGVSGSPDQITDSPGSYGIFSMNGARGRSNNFLLDGTDMNDGFRNDPAINEAGVFGDPATILPLEAIAELNVLSNYEPEYGRNAGAVVNIVTKSGTNQFHGTALEYFRNKALNSRNYFNTDGTPKGTFHNNQFGASMGGPIQKGQNFLLLRLRGPARIRRPSYIGLRSRLYSVCRLGQSGDCRTDRPQSLAAAEYQRRRRRHEHYRARSDEPDRHRNHRLRVREPQRDQQSRFGQPFHQHALQQRH